MWKYTYLPKRHLKLHFYLRSMTVAWVEATTYCNGSSVWKICDALQAKLDRHSPCHHQISWNNLHKSCLLLTFFFLLNGWLSSVYLVFLAVCHLSSSLFAPCFLILVCDSRCYATPGTTFIGFINCLQPVSLDPSSKHVLCPIICSFPLSYLSFCVIFMRNVFRSRQGYLDT